jgi:putative transposase
MWNARLSLERNSTCANPGSPNRKSSASSKELKAGVKAATICRKHGISGATLYNWRAKYGGLEVSDLRRLKELEDENRRLKKIVADQALNIEALKVVAEGNF